MTWTTSLTLIQIEIGRSAVKIIKTYNFAIDINAITLTLLCDLFLKKQMKRIPLGCCK